MLKLFGDPFELLYCYFQFLTLCLLYVELLFNGLVVLTQMFIIVVSSAFEVSCTAVSLSFPPESFIKVFLFGLPELLRLVERPLGFLFINL
jgi:hypothetical protein